MDLVKRKRRIRENLGRPSPLIDGDIVSRGRHKSGGPLEKFPNFLPLQKSDCYAKEMVVVAAHVPGDFNARL